MSNHARPSVRVARVLALLALTLVLLAAAGLAYRALAGSGDVAAPPGAW